MGQADVHKNIVNLEFKIQTDKPLQTCNIKNTWSQKKQAPKFNGKQFKSMFGIVVDVVVVVYKKTIL
jgi:hypothetical protein